MGSQQDEIGSSKTIALSKMHLVSEQRDELEMCSAAMTEAEGTVNELGSELADSLARTVAAKKETGYMLEELSVAHSQNLANTEATMEARQMIEYLGAELAAYKASGTAEVELCSDAMAEAEF